MFCLDPITTHHWSSFPRSEPSFSLSASPVPRKSSGEACRAARHAPTVDAGPAGVATENVMAVGLIAKFVLSGISPVKATKCAYVGALE